MRERTSFIWKQRHSLRGNTRPLLQFEWSFKLLIIALSRPLYSLLERFLLWASGYSYLTAENVRRFMVHPATLFALFLLGFLFAFLVLMDMAGVLYCIHLSFMGSGTDYLQIFPFAFSTALGMVRTRGKRFFLFMVLFFLPLYAIGIAPAIYGNGLFKDLLLKKAFKDGRIVAALVIFVLGTVLFFMGAMFSLTYAILEGEKVGGALKKSFRLGKGSRIKNLLVYLLFQLFSYLAYAISLGGAMAIAFLGEHLVKPFSFVNPISTSLMLTITTVALIFLAAWSAPLGFICIAWMYYVLKLQKGEEIPGELVVKERRRVGKHRAFLRWAVLLLCSLSFAIYVFSVYEGRFNPRIEYLHSTEVTAHRGASRYYPENTMAAFRGALEQEADWIELDIHLSKDQQLIVLHDSSLYRTCGVNGYCWDYTWEEISQMDAGRKFGKVYIGERIPLLSEVIDFALENRIRLNIEIKPSRYEAGLEEKLVELLREKEFLEECVVTSQKYSSIEKIKELEEQVFTVYVMGYAYGSIDRLKAADAFSVNRSSVTSRLVSRVHNAGKQIYAWTVNRRFYIEEMIEKNVDNIITDDVKLAKKIVAEKRTSNALHEYLRWLNHWFR